MDLEGIYYGLAVLGILVLIHWYVTNDRVKPGEPTKGLLAMRRPSDKEKAKAEKSRNKRAPRPRWTHPGQEQ